MDIADELRELIKKSGKSHNRIATETGLSQPSINRFVNGRRSISFDTMKILADYFGYDVVLKKQKKK